MVAVACSLVVSESLPHAAAAKVISNAVDIAIPNRNLIGFLPLSYVLGFGLTQIVKIIFFQVA